MRVPRPAVRTLVRTVLTVITLRCAAPYDFSLSVTITLVTCPVEVRSQRKKRLAAACRKFGQTYANSLRRRRPRPGDK